MSSIPRLGVKMDNKNYKTRQEHVDGEQEQKEKEVEEMIRMLRKQQGKNNQTRNFQDESSVPKQRRTDNDSYKELRNTSVDGEGDKTDMSGKRKGVSPPDMSDMTPKNKKKKTQTIMERFLKNDWEKVDGPVVVSRDVGRQTIKWMRS